jgi:hypothetical protein
MKKNYLAIFIAMLMLAGIPEIVQCALVTKTFMATVLDGPLAGQIGTGSFTFDDDLIIRGDEFIDPEQGLMVAFSFDNQIFDQTNDSDFDDWPVLRFDDSVPQYLEYWLVDGENGVNFNNPLLVWLYIGDSELLASSGNYDFETEISTQLIPIPGAVWLFTSGIAGLVVLGIRKRYTE